MQVRPDWKVRGTFKELAYVEIHYSCSIVDIQVKEISATIQVFLKVVQTRRMTKFVLHVEPYKHDISIFNRILSSVNMK